MPDLDTKKPRRQLKNIPPDRFQPKVLIFWIALLLAVVSLLFWSPGITVSPATLTIFEVVTHAESSDSKPSDIKSGVIQPDNTVGKDWVLITGELNAPTLTNERGMKTASFRAAGRLTDSNMERLQKTNKFSERPTTTVLAQLALSVLPVLIIIGFLYFLFSRQLRQAGRGALNFGKSRAKLLTRDRDKVTFGDVAGCDEAKEEVSEVVEFLKDPKKFTKMGGRIPKGILMVGPPGTGKTLLAKAVAGEADVPFFSISGSDFVEMFVGVGASRVRDMFEQGRKSAPCLIFIDEIDAVGRQRGAGLGGGNDEREQTLNSLLVEMDGFDTTEGVIIIAATNRPDVLDSALLRPGRFDRQIYVDLPDMIGREQILRVHARKLTLGDNVDLGVIARGTPGLSGAELANLLNEAALLAKAIAGEADVPFFSISGSDFVEMFVGVGASRVRDMFEQGRKNAPCLIFIDEIDAVGRQRGAGLGGGNDEREQTLNSLLVEMDGFDTQEGVIIIAATNRPDVLDSALLRPGRFDRQVYIDLPDIIGREQILRVHARKISLSENVELGIIARGTPGLSGAELANLLNESALLAARRGKKKVEMTDIDEARDKVLWGRERRRVMDDNEKRLVAWHEAGHAIVQAVLDDGTVPVHKVTIIPRGQSLGSTTYLPTKDILTQPKKKLLNQIAMAMGGRIAEELVTGDFSNGVYGDLKQATRIARAMVCDYGMSELGPVAMGDNQDTVFLGRDITRSQHVSEDTARKIDIAISDILHAQYQRAQQIITEHRPALDKIGAALLEHETIEGKHVLEIIQHGEIRTPIISAKPPRLAPETAKPAAAPAAPEPAGAPGTPAPSPA